MSQRRHRRINRPVARRPFDPKTVNLRDYCQSCSLPLDDFRKGGICAPCEEGVRMGPPLLKKVIRSGVQHAAVTAQTRGGLPSAKTLVKQVMTKEVAPETPSDALLASAIEASYRASCVLAWLNRKAKLSEGLPGEIHVLHNPYDCAKVTDDAIAESSDDLGDGNHRIRFAG